MESDSLVTQERDYQRINLEKSISDESIQQEYQRCCCIYDNVLSREIEASLPDLESNEHCVDHRFNTYIGDPNFIKLAKSLKFLKFFNVKRVSLKISKMRNKHNLNFLDFSLPNKTNELVVYLFPEVKINRGTYFNSLIMMSSKITCVVDFEFFCLSLRQIKRFMAAYRHVEKLRIWYCKLSIPTVPDFSKALKNCQIQEICLMGTGGKSYSNWGDHPEEFINLIQGFSTSLDLRLSLREVSIWNCKVKQREAEEIFAENQLEGVKVLNGC
ncbi:unnamed protein product [Moneuplotes crassus]|uniref:Uncharacterized protein n=1 Tax=Euplotes crassus TaxID=5936 RepID=A0AAD1UDA0_EUPCR|nr:unnamed protein product [Moneuplotes crassus]